MRGTIEDRFWAKVQKTNGCWLWTGAKRQGYGALARTRADGPVYAHRFAWEIHNGTIPSGMWVLHRCDVRACVRPDHLWLGSQQENNADCVAKGRNARGEARGFNKLNEQQVRAIRVLYDSGWRPRDIAPLFGVTDSNVKMIGRRIRWQHLPG